MSMKKTLALLSLVAASALFSGCSTVDATYTSAKGIGQSAIGGVGNVIGNGAADAGRSLGVVSNAAGQVVSGGGKIIGGGLDLVGGMVKGTSDIVAPAPGK
jgi:predicted small secreted protein